MAFSILMIGAAPEKAAALHAPELDITCVGSVEEARAWCESHHPDAIVMEHAEMELLKKLFEKAPEKPVAILALEKAAAPQVIIQAVEISQLKAELKRVSETADDYMHTVAHDLKAPLRHIISYCGFLQEDYAEKLGGEGKQFIERISAGALRLHQMLDDLRIGVAKSMLKK